MTGIYTSEDIEKLKVVSGFSGQSATDALVQINNISISKDKALELAVIMKRRYAQQVVDIYPETVKLHPHCQGVLLSLIINRGKQLGTRDSRREMVEIQSDLRANRASSVPARLRSMKRLWEMTRKLVVLLHAEKKKPFILRRA